MFMNTPNFPQVSIDKDITEIEKETHTDTSLISCKTVLAANIYLSCQYVRESVHVLQTWNVHRMSSEKNNRSVYSDRRSPRDWYDTAENRPGLHR